MVVNGSVVVVTVVELVDVLSVVVVVSRVVDSVVLVVGASVVLVVVGGSVASVVSTFTLMYTAKLTSPLSNPVHLHLDYVVIPMRFVVICTIK